MTSAELLARCKVLANTPSVDVETPDALWYQLLSDAAVHWQQQLAVAAPGVVVGTPVVLTSTDNGYTYDLPSDPIGEVNLYRTYHGDPMAQGSYGDREADYVREGARKIRLVSGRAESFSQGGPIARYVSAPAAISATVQPTMQPLHLRTLLVTRAVILWSLRGGFRDPAPYLLLEQHQAYGDPSNPQSQGLITGLRLSYGATGAPGGSSTGAGWRSMAF